MKKMCMEMGVNYVEMGGLCRDRDLWLWKDGLHLNWEGADMMGREIYKHLFYRGTWGGGRNELNRVKVTREGNGILGNRACREKKQEINLDNQEIKLGKGTITENRQRKINLISCLYCNAMSINIIITVICD